MHIRPGSSRSRPHCSGCLPQLPFRTYLSLCNKKAEKKDGVSLLELLENKAGKKNDWETIFFLSQTSQFRAMAEKVLIGCSNWSTAIPRKCRALTFLPPLLSVATLSPYLQYALAVGFTNKPLGNYIVHDPMHLFKITQQIKFRLQVKKSHANEMSALFLTRCCVQYTCHILEIGVHCFYGMGVRDIPTIRTRHATLPTQFWMSSSSANSFYTKVTVQCLSIVTLSLFLPLLSHTQRWSRATHTVGILIHHSP